MFNKLGIFGFVLAVFMALIPTVAQAKEYYHNPRHYPQGYYYRGGRWLPYHGHGHPYRGGYYDRFGRWHRYSIVTRFGPQDPTAFGTGALALG